MLARKRSHADWRLKPSASPMRAKVTPQIAQSIHPVTDGFLDLIT
jgi:hypothetical protein